ncbi:MAG: NAD(P)/FAD-dependent oxidoreductase [Akkermansiaceae bacterium]
MKPIIIIGNGIAGVTAAREIRKLDTKVPIIIISGETDHHFSRTALMYIFMGHMNYEDTKPHEDRFWTENKIQLLRGWVTSFDHQAQKITMKDLPDLEYSELVLAVGSVPNKFGWPGQDLPGVQGLYSKQDLDNLEESAKTAKRAVITGGGLIGIEMAEMLLTRGIPVSFLVREKLFWGSVLPKEEAIMIEKHIREHHCDLQMGEELESIHEGENGRVAYVTTKKGDRIDCEIVGLTAGVRPNIQWLSNNDQLETDRGIVIDHYFQTNLPHVWSIGDCAQFKDPLPGRRPLEQVWYTGKMHGAHLAQNLVGERKAYEPGIWWNSAKFFDIEYQTYGIVMPQPQEDEETFFWQAPEGYHTIRINYNTDTLAVKGVNVFGMRHRHQVWENWIASEAKIPDVVRDLAAANFDPEFFKQHERSIIETWNKQHPEHQVSLNNNIKKGLFSKLLRSLQPST